MENSLISSVRILGLGTLGSICAAKLYELKNMDLRIVADQLRQARLIAPKTTVNGKAYSFNFADPDDQPAEPADLIIIAVKSHQLEQGIRDIRAFIGKETVVMPLLNGISSREIIVKYLGLSHIIYAYAIGMDAAREQNAVYYKNMGKIVFGGQDNQVPSEKAMAVKSVFEHAGIPYEIPADMCKAMWFKFMMDTGVSQVSAVLKAPYGILQKNTAARELMRMAAEEVLLLSHKLGVNLASSDVDRFLEVIDTFSPLGKPSMLRDIESGRKSEVDAFAGTVIGLGRAYGIPMPVNETLAQIILSIESGQVRQ